MNFGKLARRIAPFAALAAATALSGCGDMNISINGEEGVPLSELDFSGDTPTGVAMGGSDAVVITSGDDFTINVDGSDEAIERMRFVLSEGTLAIGRANDSSNGGGIATVLITMPAPETLAMGGSGSITADTMASNAEIVVGGSGSVEVASVDADSLEVVIGGSGSATTSGTADRLEVTVGGSGSALMPDLQTERGEVNIGGSGDVSFSSDGRVEANIAGSGTVRVFGSATCEANTIGSGELICEEVVETAE
ncbi:head GIN domain-containing protein [Aurantiacibacter sp. MUD61]|uniref:head GIN domain-containing protein n=1 Tax=Aurantiacibacter sp. MUD61 TaxID=3009083 RepID=UPI0022F018E1|nr:head GIN domain-containing protein [Aurantiacibacter sp. MUD61]